MVLLTIFGVGTMFFVLVTLTELFVAGDLSGLLDERRMQSKIAQLKDHYLICGFGRVGRQVAKDLRAGEVPFVVIDDNPDVREHAEEEDVLLVEGRGSDDHTMQEAGIERACAVVACVDSDAENIFVTLTARELRPDIPIVARAAVESSERKLIRAGANEVVSPYKASGRTMASLALVAPQRGRPGTCAKRSRRRRGDLGHLLVTAPSGDTERAPAGPVERLREVVVEVAARCAEGRGPRRRRSSARPGRSSATSRRTWRCCSHPR